MYRNPNLEYVYQTLQSLTSNSTFMEAETAVERRSKFAHIHLLTLQSFLCGAGVPKQLGSGKLDISLLSMVAIHLHGVAVCVINSEPDKNFSYSSSMLFQV